jgi:citrate synthase
VRLIAKMPTLAAFAYRHAVGLPYAYPDNDLSYAGNFLNMMWKTTELQYEPDPVLERALNVLLILHADHEQNCSAHVMRAVGSAHADPYSALRGRGRRGRTVRSLARGGQRAGAWHAEPDRLGRGDPRLRRSREAGRVPSDGLRAPRLQELRPRAQIIKRVAGEVLAVTGSNSLLDIALELERIALEDAYFIEHKLYPNVDFYSGIIYQTMGFPVEMLPVLFAIGRTPGWLARWEEGVLDPEQRISRPRQVYVGMGERHLAIDRTSLSG